MATSSCWESPSFHLSCQLVHVTLACTGSSCTSEAMGQARSDSEYNDFRWAEEKQSLTIVLTCELQLQQHLQLSPGRFHASKDPALAALAPLQFFVCHF